MQMRNVTYYCQAEKAIQLNANMPSMSSKNVYTHPSPKSNYAPKAGTENQKLKMIIKVGKFSFSWHEFYNVKHWLLKNIVNHASMPWGSLIQGPQHLQGNAHRMMLIPGQRSLCFRRSTFIKKGQNMWHAIITTEILSLCQLWTLLRKIWKREIFAVIRFFWFIIHRVND